ncbi:MAG: hypothetical protein HY554_03645 [Elusimicrobia bacterium]|nr:hypothetical protein [Elusimicrobiota bacterium]
MERWMIAALLVGLAPASVQAQDFPRLAGAAAFDWTRPQWEAIPGFREAERRSACGFVAGEGIIRFFWRDPGMDVIGELKHVARAHGWWSAGDGMYGSEAFQAMMSHFGMELTLQPEWLDARWRTEASLNEDPAVGDLYNRMLAVLERGYPVVLATTRHYFLVQGHDGQGRLLAGNTGEIMAYRGLGGSSWMTVGAMARNGDIVVGLLAPAAALIQP